MAPLPGGVANATMVSFGIIQFFCGKNRQNRRNMPSTGTDVKIIGSLELANGKFYTFDQELLSIIRTNSDQQ